PTVSGTFTFTIRAADASNAANYTTRRMPLIVSPVGIVNSVQRPPGTASTFYSQQLQASGGSGSYIWSVAPGNFLPQGLTLTSGGPLSSGPRPTGPVPVPVHATAN